MTTAAIGANAADAPDLCGITARRPVVRGRCRETPLP